MKEEKKKGIIFDLDGTLWDSSVGVVASWNEILDEYPEATIPADLDWMKRLMGKTMTVIEEEFLGYIKDEVRRHEIMERCMSHENEYLAVHGGELFDGLSEVLAELGKKYHLSIVSNCQTGYIPTFFKAHGTDRFFDDYEEFGRTGLGKADNIRLVKERNGLESAVYVGDTMGDYEAARDAGVLFIHAAYGFGKVPEGTPAIHDLRELPSFVEREKIL